MLPRTMVLIATLVTPMLVGCAAPSVLKDVLEEQVALAAFAPRDLNAPLATTGLLVVDATLKHQGSMSFGQVETHMLTSATVMPAGAEERRLTSGAIGGVVVMQDLPPGTYRVSALRGSTGRSRISVRVDQSKVPPFQIVAGKVTYLGHLVVKGTSRMGQLGLTTEYDWDMDLSKQVTALRRVRDQYPASAWAPVLEEQVQTISKGTPR